MAAAGGRINHKMSGSAVIHSSNSNSSVFQVETLFNRMPFKTNLKQILHMHNLPSVVQ